VSHSCGSSKSVPLLPAAQGFCDHPVVSNASHVTLQQYCLAGTALLSFEYAYAFTVTVLAGTPHYMYTSRPASWALTGWQCWPCCCREAAPTVDACAHACSPWHQLHQVCQRLRHRDEASIQLPHVVVWLLQQLAGAVPARKMLTGDGGHKQWNGSHRRSVVAAVGSST
jgi:hypothetical protein